MRKTHRLAMAAIGLLLAVVCSGQSVPTYTLSIVAKTGDTIDGLTITLINGGLSINNHRDVAYLANYSGGGTALLTQNGVLVKAGDTIDGHTFAQVGAGTPAINNNGLAAFNGFADVRGLFTQNALVVLQNGTISGILLSAGFSGNLALNDSGTLAFSGGNNTQFGIFTQNGVVALIGDTIGGLTLTNVGLSPALNNAGTVAFNGFFSGGSGIFTGTGLLVRVGDTISGWRITNISSSPSLNTLGVVAFNARDNSGGSGIFTQNAVVAHDGDSIGGLTVTVIPGDNPAINASGTVAFAAQFINSLGQGRLGFFTQNGPVAKGGDVVDGKTLAGFFGTNGSVVAINAQGDVAFVSRFSDSTQGVVLARYNNTPAGSGVTVQPIDMTTGTTPVSLTFNTVTAAGVTDLTTSNSGPPPPSGFQLGAPPTYYNLVTTASFTPPVQVCINYTGISFTDESQLRLLHFEGGTWVDETTSLDTINHIVCGSVTSFSPFAVFRRLDNTPPVIVPTITGTAGTNGWYTSNVTVSWSVTDPESGIASSAGCGSTNLIADTSGTTLSCSATNGAGLSSSAQVTVKIDKTPPSILGMPAAGCSLSPPNHKMVQVATVTATDALSGLVPNSLRVTGTSNEPNDPNDPDVVITPNGSGGYVIQLRADRSGNGTGRIYTLSATAMDLAGNSAVSSATCVVPHDQGH